MIALIDYGAGNTASVANSLKTLNADYILTNVEEEIKKCEKVIFPGVGEASSAIKKINEIKIFSLLKEIDKPMLGICLGLQLMCAHSEEGDVDCLGIFPADTVKFVLKKSAVPHMGWNQIYFKKKSKLFEGIKEGEFFYFAHSYYVPMNEYTTAYTSYEIDFSAALEKDNFYGLQFHPEKSSHAGLKILRNFIELC
jgi:glutamine amidotransferase